MFKEKIMWSAFSSADARFCYDRKFDYKYLAAPDRSLHYTLTALLKDRVPDDETITIQGTSQRTLREPFKGCYGYDLMYMCGTLLHLQLSGNYLEENACYFRRELGSYGYEEIEKITVFFQKTFKVWCFVNTESKTCIIITEPLDIRKFHYLQCASLVFFPWYFNSDDGITDEEMNLINSLRETTPDKYLESLKVLAGNIGDMRDERTKSLVSKVSFSRYDKAIEQNETSKKRIGETIEEYTASLIEAYRQLDKLNAIILGMKQKRAESQDNDEILDYFLQNKNIIVVDATENSLEFIVKTQYEYYDEEQLEKYIEKDNSYLFLPRGNNLSNYVPTEDMRMFLRAVFIEKTLRMNVCANYTITSSGYVEAKSNYDYGDECQDCIPNTHIDSYSCLGNYKYAIIECLNVGDYIGAAEQCVASAESLNFGDSAVMEIFMEQMYGYNANVNTRCVVLPSGNVVTPKEAIEWLKENKEGNNE